MWWRKKTDHPEHQVLRCSFCNKWQHDVERLIAGPKLFICDECVEICNDIIADDKRVSKSAGATRVRGAEEPIPWPKRIECALCHVAIPTGDGIAITGNRGTVCADCVKAVAAMVPHREL
jgi:hypothetical protein